MGNIAIQDWVSTQTKSKFEEPFLKALLPPPVYSVDQWSDENRILSQKTSSEYGKYKTSRTPYLRDLMIDLSDDSEVQEVIVMKAAQTGFSEMGNNWIGYTIDHSPGPMLCVQPSDKLAARYSKQRIEPMIEDTACLKKKISEKKSRDSGNTILEKDFPGGVLVFAGANAPSGLRSMPVKKLMLDEIDCYPLDCGGEGDPVKLAEKRQNTFGSKRKRLKISTPTIEGKSKIAREFETSDQRYYFVPCLECGHMQDLKWPQLKWPKGSPTLAKYHCVECDHAHENWQKTKMMDTENGAHWRPTKPENINKIRKGYHLNGLYSPSGWLSWGEIAQEWEDIQKTKDPLELKTFINTVLSETWKEKTDQPNWNRLYERRETYPMGEIPNGGILLVAGADVQKDRIEYEVVVYGRGKESWSIDYGVIMGDTSAEKVWSDLSKLLNHSYPMADNPEMVMPIKMLGVDSGYNTQHVYNWTRKYPSFRVVATKGTDTLATIVGIPRAVDITMRGKTISRGTKFWPIGVNHLKTELYGWLRLNKPIDGQPYPQGYCHFPEYDNEFFQMLTAEKMVYRRNAKGYIKGMWEKERERNEALDCRCIARACAYIQGLDRMTEEKWVKMENEIGTCKPINTMKQMDRSTRPKRKRKESSWL